MRKLEKLRLNTSNQGKLAEYQRLFAQYEIAIEATKIDLDEIDADALSVVAHKASQIPEGVLVEDTSLDIKDAQVGVNVRWLLDHLNELEGRKARWTCLLAQRIGNQVDIYSAEVRGTIVTQRGGQGFGFDPYFLPCGEQYTLAQDKPDRVNARALATAAFVEGAKLCTVDPIYDWDGPWQ